MAHTLGSTYGITQLWKVVGLGFFWVLGSFILSPAIPPVHLSVAKFSGPTTESALVKGKCFPQQYKFQGGHSAVGNTPHAVP